MSGQLLILISFRRVGDGLISSSPIYCLSANACVCDLRVSLTVEHVGLLIRDSLLMESPVMSTTWPLFSTNSP